MKQKITSFFVYILCPLILLGGFLFYPNNAAESDQLNLSKTRKADEILVKFKNSNDLRVIKIDPSCAPPLARSGATAGRQNDNLNKALDSYNNNPEVEYAEPNYLYRASIIPSDTYYSNQWYLQKIKATQAWNQIRESPDIVIAIVDSGVQIDHPDLRDNIWRNSNEIAGNGIDDDKNGFIDDAAGWDFVNNTADPNPKFENGFTEDGILHGTVVAGIIAASGNNAAGIAGVTWKARLMPLRVLNGKGEGDTSKVIKAIDYAINNGADIINLSFVGFGFSRSLDNAIKRAYDTGIIIVAAAGNEQGEGDGYFLDQTPMYPACHDGPANENWVIGVAATDALDQKADFSSHGFKCVDIAAPGISIYSTVVYSPAHYINDKYFDKHYDGYWSGTSMAAPMVSGAAALVGQVNLKFNRDQIVSALLDNSDDINRLNPDYLNQLGRGRLNIFRAVNYAENKLVEKTIKLLTVPYSGQAGLIKTTDKDGIAEQEFFAYADNFLGGATIASGDVDGDGIDEIITGAGFTGGPHVRIFSQDGKLKGQFFAYAEHFRGGVNVASGDVDGDGIDEIITGAGFTGGPQVRIFKADGRVEAQFFAYNSNFRGGVKVAVANIDSGSRNQQAEIITAPGAGGGPHIRIFNNHANVRAQFFAYDRNFKGGVNIAAGDVDGDGLIEVITGAGPGGTPHVRAFETNGALIGSFYAYEAGFDGGVNVGTLEVRR